MNLVSAKVMVLKVSIEFPAGEEEEDEPRGEDAMEEEEADGGGT